jgi:hypothetical protein
LQQKPEKSKDLALALLGAAAVTAVAAVYAAKP